MRDRKMNDTIRYICEGKSFRFVLHKSLPNTMKLSPREEDQWWKEHQYGKKYVLASTKGDNMFFSVDLPDRSGVRRSGWYINKVTGELHVPCEKQEEVYTAKEYYIEFL